MNRFAMAMSLEALSGSQLEALCSDLLAAEGFTLASQPSVPEVDFIAVTADGDERWVVECKARASALRPALLQLASHQRLLSAQRALLVTTAVLPQALREEVAEPLGITVWDRAALARLLGAHAGVAATHLGARTPPVRRPGVTRLRRLSLRNFRGIEELALEFGAGPMTALVGVNGAGKSAILDAIAKLLLWPAGRMFDSRAQGRSIEPYDLRRGSARSEIALEAVLEGIDASWRLTGVRGTTRVTSKSELEGLKSSMDVIRAALERDPDSSVPLFVYYPVNRAVIEIPRRRGRTKGHDLDVRRLAHQEALVGGKRDFRRFFDWFREREDLENERRTRSPERRDHQLEAVRSAIEALMPGVSHMRIARAPMRMLVTKGAQHLAVDQLSDGEKCLLAMVGDLARRLALANPVMDDPRHGAGLVLIDEIDLHLHPTWQRAVIPALLQTFPGCQFVVSTHSPQVIAALDRSCVKLLEDGQLVKETPHTFGRDANAILDDIMGLPPHPPAVAAVLRGIALLIDEDRLGEARRKLDELATDLGESDPEVVRNRALIEFLED